LLLAVLWSDVLMLHRLAQADKKSAATPIFFYFVQMV
jgi:hypothetical protein